VPGQGCTLPFTFICLTTEERHGKTSVRVAEECQLARWKKNIQNRAHITITIYEHNNKNTGTLKFCAGQLTSLTLILLTWRIWRDPNNASKWQIGFNLVFKGLNPVRYLVGRLHTDYSSEPRQVFLPAFINIDRINRQGTFYLRR
jgi:hypothetical protein